MSARRIPGLVCPKGWAVRPLKRYASWVQNVVRQFGPIRHGRWTTAGPVPQYEEDWED